MHEPPHNMDDDWAGLELESPTSGSRWLLYAGAGIALLFGLTVGAVAAYLAWSQFRERTAGQDIPAVVVPTSAVSEAPAAETPDTDSTSTLPVTETPDIAPTSTLLPTAAATSIPLTGGAVEAFSLTTAPIIDGNLSEWTGTVAASSDNRVFSVAGWDGSEDLTAVWQLAWDNTNLYVAVSVTDDTHVQTASGNQIFRGDSVDMQFDTARDADFGAGLSPDDFQITLSPGDFAGSGPMAFRYRGTTSGAILDAPGGHSVAVAAQQTGTGYTLEAAIPWSDLNLEPSEGLTIGLALNANDNDTPGTAVQEVMLSHMPNRTLTDPTTWGTLTLK